MLQVAIIGAGFSGLACAGQLRRHGHRAVLFDKGRGPGGRASSRREGDESLDLGAQYFSVRDAAFAAEVDRWEAAGVATPWPPSSYRVDASGAWHEEGDDQHRYCGTPRMSAITRHLAAPHELFAATRVTRLTDRLDGWWLEDPQGDSYGPFDRVVVTAPAAQAEPLLRPHDEALAQACREIRMLPCWSAWVRFDTALTLEGIDADWPVVRFDQGPLRLAVRQNRKPGREHQSETLSLLARDEWSQRHLEDDAEDVVSRLTAALQKALATRLPTGSSLPQITASGAHRWRYATADLTLAAPDHRLGEDGLALAGDGLRGGRIEDAWLSGVHVAEALHRTATDA
ncbi:NAD(P)/FAD-dependent oxidoreductase [Halomonas sp. DN3]|uniref:NAD(P)/FAD-dependent oxidoreductase n=1 Tax=Halomonas sp. DN3 TaxID=2953657 RepID=UPI00209F7064|nr:FAD-dependent oxidoreductase [Halomonas sp. DN3]USZ49440.1 FAD-dependent oxidoreductase [Halomonas sp. DN3]